MSELEAFARDWEAAERSRHLRLMEQLKRELRAEPRVSAPVEEVIDAPYSVRLPQQQVRSQSHLKGVQPLPQAQRNHHEPV